MTSNIDGRTAGLNKNVYDTLKGLQQARKGEALTQSDVDKVVKEMAKDGKIDAAESDLLDEIQANSVSVDVAKNEHDSKPLSIKFGQASQNLREQALDKASEVARLSSMSRRASQDRGTVELESLKQTLRKDQELAGLQADGSKTRYGAKGDVATKILIQDGILLERRGLLTPPDKAFLSEMIAKRGLPHPQNQLSPEDLQRLDQMVEKGLEYLEGPNPEIQFVDQSTLLGVGTPEGGEPAAQYAAVDSNYPALVGEADAAVHDVEASIREVGLNQEALKEQKGRDVEAGRSFERIAQAIEEADRQFLLLHDNVLPAIKQELDSLKSQSDQRLLELTGKTSLEDAEKALDSDPSLREKARTDATLNQLKSQYATVSDKYTNLTHKMLALDEARVKGLKSLSTIKIIDQEMKQRIASVQSMSAKLGTGMLNLNGLRDDILATAKKFDALGNQASGIESRELTGADNQAKLGELQQKGRELDATADKVTFSDKELQTYKTRATAVADEMIAGMDELIAKYESTSTHHKSTLGLLRAQRQTLVALKNGFDTRFDPIKAVQDLEASRSKILGTLKGLVPQHLDMREYKALSGLDGGVTDFSKAHTDVRAAHSYAQGRSLAAKGSIGSARELVMATGEELKAAIKRAEEGKDSAMEEASAALKAIDDRMAFGTHARVYLGIGAGVGADIGVAKAKVAIGVEGAVKVEKAFGSGPAYMMHVDLAAKVSAEVKLDLILTEIGASAEFKAGLQAGLAFNTLQEAQDFAAELTRLAGYAIDLKTKDLSVDSLKQTEANLSASWQKLKGMYEQHKYSATFVEGKLEVAAARQGGAEGKANLKGGTIWGSYADGSEIKDSQYSGGVSVNGYGVQVTHESSVVQKQPTNGSKVGDSHRTLVELKIPLRVVKDIHKHGLKGIPDTMKEAIASALKAANPAMAKMQTTEIFGILGDAFASDKKGLSKLIALGETFKSPSGASSSSKEVNFNFGVAFGQYANGENFITAEISVEASIDKRKDFGAGSTFLRIEGGASMRLGVILGEYKWKGDSPPQAATPN